MTYERRTNQVKMRSWLIHLGITVPGLLVLSYASFQTLLQYNSGLVYLLILSVAGSWLALKVSRGGDSAGSVTVSLGDFAVFTAMVLVGPTAAAVMAAVEGLISSLRVKIRRPSKILFNVAQLTIAGFLVGHLFQNIEGGSGALLAFKLVLCSVLYLFLSTIFVSAAMAASSGQSILDMWKRGFFWALPTHVANGCLVGILLTLFTGVNLGVLLGIIPLVFMAYFLRGASQTVKTYGLFSAEFINDSLPKRARGYLFTVGLIALPIYIYSLYQTAISGNWAWLYLLGLAIVSSSFPLRIFSIRDRIWLTLSDVLVFVGLISFGPSVAVVIASVDALVINIRKKPGRGYRWLFNLSQIIVVSFTVGHLVQLIRDNSNWIGNTELLISSAVLGGFGLLYFLISAGLTSQAVALSTRTSCLRIWVTNLKWCLPSVLGACLGALAGLMMSGM